MILAGTLFIAGGLFPLRTMTASTHLQKTETTRYLIKGINREARIRKGLTRRLPKRSICTTTTCQPRFHNHREWFSANSPKGKMKFYIKPNARGLQLDRTREERINRLTPIPYQRAGNNGPAKDFTVIFFHNNAQMFRFLSLNINGHFR